MIPLAVPTSTLYGEVVRRLRPVPRKKKGARKGDRAARSELEQPRGGASRDVCPVPIS